MKLLKCFLLLSAFLCLVGCSNPFGDSKSNVDTNYGTETSTPTPTGYQTISAARINVETVSRNHKLSLAVGNSPTSMKLKTTNNKTVYLSVQGQSLSN